MFLCSSSFFLFLTSSDCDSEKLPLKYIVEQTRLYVSLKLEKNNSDELFSEKNPIDVIVKRTSERGVIENGEGLNMA